MIQWTEIERHCSLFFFGVATWKIDWPIKVKNFNKSILSDNFIKFLHCSANALFANALFARVSDEMTKCSLHEDDDANNGCACEFSGKIAVLPMSQLQCDAVTQPTCLNVMNLTNLLVDKMNGTAAATGK